MRGNRTLLLIVLVVVVLGGGFFVWQTLLKPKPAPTTPETPTPTEETPTPVQEIEIVVAAQPTVPRGWQFSPDDGSVVLTPWPVDRLPLGGYYTDTQQLNGAFLRVDVPRGMPITPDMLAFGAGTTAMPASRASLFMSGRRAYAIPVDTQGALGWMIQPGDHVDVAAAFKLLWVDSEFQSPLPNQFLAVPVEAFTGGTGAVVGGGPTLMQGVYGRFETLPNGVPIMVYPAEQALPSLVVQLTVQDAIVWHVGLWKKEGTPTPTATVTATPTSLVGGLGQAPTTTPTPVPLATPEFSDVDLVTLLVTPQDALVLKYLMEMGADLDLLLRPAGETADLVLTEPVMLRYIIDRYQIPASMSNLPVAPLSLREPLTLTPFPTPTPPPQ